MIEVSMTLYSPEEATMFAQFTEILVGRRNAIAKFVGSVGARQALGELEQAEQELEQESEAAYPNKEAYGKSVVQAQREQTVDAPATPSPDTVAQAIEKFKAYAQANGLPQARAVLDQLGLKRAGDVTAAQIPALLEAIQ